MQSTVTSAVGDSITVMQSVAGLIDFVFHVLTTDSTVHNGSNGTASLSLAGGDSGSVPPMPSFFIQQIDGNTVRLMLDDGGAGPDKDLDDMVLELHATAVSVPEPGTLALFGAGLLAVGVVRRRSRGTAVARAVG
jgi:hypothetical protein